MDGKFGSLPLMGKTEVKLQNLDMLACYIKTIVTRQYSVDHLYTCMFSDSTYFNNPYLSRSVVLGTP